MRAGAPDQPEWHYRHSSRASHASDHGDFRTRDRSQLRRQDRRRRPAGSSTQPRRHQRLSWRTGGLMLTIERLQASYGKVQTLWEIGFEVRKGEIVALIG